MVCVFEECSGKERAPGQPVAAPVVPRSPAAVGQRGRLGAARFRSVPVGQQEFVPRWHWVPMSRSLEGDYSG